MDQKVEADEYPEEQEDEVIQKIKTIGSQIFSSFSDNKINSRIVDDDLNPLNFKKSFNFQQKHQEQRKYSQTERCYVREGEGMLGNIDSIEKNDSIGNFRQELERQDDVQNKQLDNKNKKISQNFKKKMLQKKPSWTHPTQNKTLKKQQSPDKQTSGKSSRIVHPPPLVSSRFLEPIGNFKEAFIKDIYEKALKVELEYKQNMNKKKSMKTLEQLYKQKEPLYERFTRDQFKKKMKMQESRVEAFQKQLQDFVGVPSINSNIQIKGSFEWRNEENRKKREKNKNKIFAQTMENTTFQPKTNSPKRYRNIESKVKNIWKSGQAKYEQEQLSSQNLGDSMDLKGISQQLLRTGSFFSDESLNSPNKNKSFQLKIKSVQQLSHILQIDDINQE